MSFKNVQDCLFFINKLLVIGNNLINYIYNNL